MKLILLAILFLSFTTLAMGQQKIETTFKSSTNSEPSSNFKLTKEARSIFSLRSNDIQKSSIPSSVKAKPFSKAFIDYNLKPTYDRESGELIAISGSISTLKSLASHDQRYINYLEIIKDALFLKDPIKEIRKKESHIDEAGRTHTRLEQVYRGIKVHGTELLIHEKNGNIYLLQGNTLKIKDDIKTNPQVDQEEAISIAKKSLDNFQPITQNLKALFTKDQVSAELIIYPEEGTQFLAWEIDIFENLASRETILINAHDGTIIHRHNTLCKYHDHINTEANFDGKATGQGQDLFGNTAAVNVYECTDGYFLVDASRPMFKGIETTCDNSEQLLNGVILTLDARGTSPVNNNFDYDIASSTSNTLWNNPTAISAHVNGGRAYEYFKNTFGRESITGNGSNIVSFINVADEDGTDMDNAFWNGEFIFYGNGNQAFNAPLAKALDVAGHEMSHGVIQTTANLEYQGESGALNEHFADVFGVLIEREDFRIGEDVTNSSIFPTGTLRSMSNPNNGGTRVGDPGYQPAHVDEQYRGNEDNGGVHLNSGIPNLAFYKFVTNESFGTDLDNRAAIGELIWYSALLNYLRSTSNFSDLRVAILQVAMDDYGPTVAAAAAQAFDEVGITDSNVTPEVEDLPTNPGNEIVVWSDVNLNNVIISDGQGVELGILSATSHISRPSATDDGRFVIFVNDQKRIQAVEVDWNTQTILRDFIIGNDPIWRNAAISKDGSKVAALRGDLSDGDFQNEIIVFDIENGTQKTFELFNPTFSEGTTEIGGVLYADVMEFNHNGEQLIYDAFNQLSGTFGQDLSYWDIGILNVWDNSTSSFGDGNIFKLFSGLPKNVSIGNPTFSKNSPSIIAFDLREIDATTDERSYSILGLNRESGSVEKIIDNNTFGYPSYSLDDSNLIFHFVNDGTKILAINGLAESKIMAEGNTFIFTENADWGIFVGTGSRDLTTALEPIEIDDPYLIYPSPTLDKITISGVTEFGNVIVQLYSLQGNLLMSQKGRRLNELDLSNLLPGTYIVSIIKGGEKFSKKIIKL